MIPSTLTTAEQTFSNCVVAHLKAFSREIDVTRFVNQNHWGMQKVLDLFLDTLWNTPEVFYVSKNCRYEECRLTSTEVRSAKIYDIHYGIERSQYQNSKARLEASVQLALQTIRGIQSPEVKALKLHDFVVETCEYDAEAMKNNDNSPLARTAYSVLVRHKAVCEGYTMAYRYLLNAVGIQSEEIISEEMNHCWNYVQLNGKWYHVDVTYDDPVFSSGITGQDAVSRFLDSSVTALNKWMNSIINKRVGRNGVSHENFLMSDVRARETRHYGWKTRGLPEAMDTRYDNRSW